MKARYWLTQISRILIGVLFIFSGWIKANDPLGFGYKLLEYFEVFGTDIFKPFATEIAMLISTFEIMLGVLLLIGAWARLTSILLLALIIFFTFLTFYSAYNDVVKDCGCFGDALHLKPWQSFSKDLILLVFILIIFLCNKLIKPIFPKRLLNMTSGIAFSIVVGYTLYCYSFLPVVDFRPYAIGEDIKKNMQLEPGAVTDSFAMTFKYQKDSKEFIFNTDDLMKVKDLATYKYVSTESKLVREGKHPKIHDFTINSNSGINMTDTFLSQEGYRLMIVQYDLSKTSIGGQQDLNKLVREIYKEQLLPIWPITASDEKTVANHKVLNLVPYNYFFADATMLKTIIRSNPGIVLFKNNVVVKMWSANNIPDFKSFREALK